jgi:hypothetical protein
MLNTKTKIVPIPDTNNSTTELQQITNIKYDR